MAQASTVSTRTALRARIVLLAAKGAPDTEIARRCGTSVPTVSTWRDRYNAAGITGLADKPIPGRRPEIDEVDVLVATLAHAGRPPAHLNTTRWSKRLLAAELGISASTVVRIWHKWDVRPWEEDAFQFFTDPQLDSNIRDVVGLYLNPPDTAVVVHLGEVSSGEAIGESPVSPVIPDRQPRERVPGPNHSRHQEFRRFLTRVARAHPDEKLHIVINNYALRKHPDVAAWLQRNPRITLHICIRAERWLAMVEIFFGIIARQAPSRDGAGPSVRELTEAISRFTDSSNKHLEPFTWSRESDIVLDTAQQPSTFRVTLAVDSTVPPL